MPVAMNKQHILEQIKRTAKENGGAPLGVDRFASATGISEAAWRGRLWARWSDAVREAGFTPNTLRPKTMPYLSSAPASFASLADTPQ